jgi:4-hydroxyproline epimerase
MRHAFFCIDGHTAGNPVRLVSGGGPMLPNMTMTERRQAFLKNYDWIRTGLCFEPRGHAMMSGGFVYPPYYPENDIGLLFIETSGCLPMCGHGTIGLITFGIESGLIPLKDDGLLRVEVPAGVIQVSYQVEGKKVSSVRIRNIESYLAKADLIVDVPDLGQITVDVAYGGNYYAIVEPQAGYQGLDSISALDLVSVSQRVREAVRSVYTPVHPSDASIRGVSHVLWTDSPVSEGASARNAVFYGDGAIDRSPCGTGTSARMAQLVAKGRLSQGDVFVHESYIGSRFIGRVEEVGELAGLPAIIPSIEGSAYMTGYNTLFIDPDEPFSEGFLVT